MEEIRFSRLKLWLAAIIVLHLSGFMLGLFLYPEELGRGPRGLLLRSSFGHYVILPVLALICFVITMRCALTAIGPGRAIVADSQGARIVTIWRSYRVAWSDLMGVRLHETRFRGNKSYSLKFDRRSGGSILLPLGALAVPESGYRGLAQRLSELHLSAVNAPQPSLSQSTAPVGREVKASPVPIETVRPVFGRKQA